MFTPKLPTFESILEPIIGASIKIPPLFLTTTNFGNTRQHLTRVGATGYTLAASVVQDKSVHVIP